MPDARDPDTPFELEPDGEPAPRRAPAPIEETEETVPSRVPRDEGEIDTRTVAERLGRSVTPVAGARPPPPGWPREALAFPLRRVRVLLVATAVLIVLDVVTWAQPFVGWALKLFALPFFLRWQLRVASMSAAGHDAPVGWADAAGAERDDLRRMVRLLALAVALLAPGLLALALSLTVPAIVLLVVGCAWTAAAALGAAVGDPSLGRPGGAVEWMSRRPLGLLAGALGWVAAGAAEVAVLALADAPLAGALAAFVGLRLATAYAWLLSARALGVVGRAWSPWEDAPA
jgi:hypothetical protein